MDGHSGWCRAGAIKDCNISLACHPGIYQIAYNTVPRISLHGFWCWIRGPETCRYAQGAIVWSAHVRVSHRVGLSLHSLETRLLLEVQGCVEGLPHIKNGYSPVASVYSSSRKSVDVPAPSFILPPVQARWPCALVPGEKPPAISP